MKTVCLYFQVHQPWRLKKYRFFNMGKDHNYLDDLMNRSIMQKVARQCYLPMNALLLKLIKENKGKFRCSFSITGIAIEQFRAFAPEVLDSFKELAATGCVEFLAETYSHSLASLASKEDFTEQVKLHANLIRKEFGVKPTAFRNTELIYSDEIGAMVAGMGFRTMLAEGAKHVLGWKSPNYVYANAIDQKLRLLLRNYKLSDDIAFRFSNKSWDEWPLTADKYVQWLASDETPGEVVNLFMDYETFGEHQTADTGIFEFMRALPKAILAKKKRPGVRHGDRSGEEIPAGFGAPLPARDVVGRRGARRDGMAGQRTAERSLLETLRPEGEGLCTEEPRLRLCMEFHADLRPFLLHGHQVAVGRRRALLLQPLRFGLRRLHQLHERPLGLHHRAGQGGGCQGGEKTGLTASGQPENGPQGVQRMLYLLTFGALKILLYE